MLDCARQIGRNLLTKLPHNIQQSYYHYRASKASLRKYLRHSEEAELLSLLPFRPKIVIDIGANHGDWTWAFLEILGKDSTFYAFEPTPALYQGLKQKFAPYPNVSIFDLAVSNKTGTANFYIADHDVLSSLEHLDNQAFKPFAVHTTPTEVQTETLDKIYSSIFKGKEIDLLKIDTQGHEETIISASEHALRYTKAVLVEWSIVAIYDNGLDFTSLHRSMIEKGFYLTHLFNRPPAEYELAWVDALYLNAKYVPKLS